MIGNALYLAIRSLWWYRGRTLIIVLCLALTLWLPVTVRLLLNQFRTDLTKRAAQTPLVVGNKGSRIDLALKGLYFDTVTPESTTMSEVFYIRDSGLADAMPLHVEYRTQSQNNVEGAPIVGTSLEYLEFRGLALSKGTSLTMLGDCLVGANVARRMGLQPGDKLLSAPRNAFNLAGDYPLRMNVVGIIAPSYSPDDDVVFVDVKTTWVIDGIGHGHQKLDHDTDEDLLLKKSDHSVTASAAVLPYTEITPENVGTFHFHGREKNFPITAVIANPHSRKEEILLLGEYASGRSEIAQCVRPSEVVDDLLQIVFRVERLVWLSSLLAAATTAMLMGLVLFLSVRLRANEIRTMKRLGCSRSMTFVLLGTEIVIMVLISLLLAGAGAFISRAVAADSLQQWLF